MMSDLCYWTLLLVLMVSSCEKPNEKNPIFKQFGHLYKNISTQFEEGMKE